MTLCGPTIGAIVCSIDLGFFLNPSFFVLYVNDERFFTDFDLKDRDFSIYFNER